MSQMQDVKWNNLYMCLTGGGKDGCYVELECFAWVPVMKCVFQKQSLLLHSRKKVKGMRKKESSNISAGARYAGGSVIRMTPVVAGRTGWNQGALLFEKNVCFLWHTADLRRGVRNVLVGQLTHGDQLERLPKQFCDTGNAQVMSCQPAFNTRKVVHITLTS